MDVMSSTSRGKRTHDDMEAVVGDDEGADELPTSWILGCGDNELGVLGQHLAGREQDAATGIRVVNPNLDAAAIRQLSCGGLMSAVLFETGEVFTFGSSDNGTLGRLFRGADTERMNMWEWERTPAPLDYDPPKIRQVAGGSMFAVALTEEGYVYVWGCYEDTENRRFRTLVEGVNPRGWHDTPFLVPGLNDIVQVYTGPAANYCYAKDVHGTLYSWGFGNCGETGRISLKDPDTGKSSAKYTLYTDEDDVFDDNGIFIRVDVLQEFLIPLPVPIPSKNVVSVACGAFSAVVVARNEANIGITYAAGNNGVGQLGNGRANPKENQLELRPIEALKNVNMSKVAPGSRHFLALSHDQEELYSWGEAHRGQLGLGAVVANGFAGCVTTPTLVTFPGLPTPYQIVDIACGEHHSMAKTADGKVYSWGATDGEESMYTGHACESGEDVYVPTVLTMMDPEAGPYVDVEVIDMAGGAKGSLFLVRACADPSKDSADNEERLESATAN